MLDSNGNLTQEANEYLTSEEIEMFNAMPRDNAARIQARQAAAINLLAAAMQRKALFEVEKRGDAAIKQANTIAALVGLAVVLQVIVEIWF